jgi:hypothetical protein
MPSRKYALAEGGPERLELRWKWNWSQMVVILDGQQIAGPFSKSELERQAIATLPDGSVLGLMLDKTMHAAELHVHLNGTPLPGSASHPGTRLKGAYGAILFIAGINIVLGIGAMTLGWQTLTDIGGGVGSIVYGAVFLVLGLLVMLRHSRIALGIALALFLVDTGLVLFSALAASGAPQIHGVVMRVLIVAFMWRGFEAINDLRERETDLRPAGG